MSKNYKDTSFLGQTPTRTGPTYLKRGIKHLLHESEIFRPNSKRRKPSPIEKNIESSFDSESDSESESHFKSISRYDSDFNSGSEDNSHSLAFAPISFDSDSDSGSESSSASFKQRFGEKRHRQELANDLDLFAQEEMMMATRGPSKKQKPTPLEYDSGPCTSSSKSPPNNGINYSTPTKTAPTLGKGTGLKLLAKLLHLYPHKSSLAGIDDETGELTTVGRAPVPGLKGSQGRHLVNIASIKNWISSAMQESNSPLEGFDSVSKILLFFVNNQKGYSFTSEDFEKESYIEIAELVKELANRSLERGESIEYLLSPKSFAKMELTPIRTAKAEEDYELNLPNFTKSWLTQFRNLIDNSSQHLPTIFTEILARYIFILSNKGTNTSFVNAGNTANYEIRLYESSKKAKNSKNSSYEVVTAQELEWLQNSEGVKISKRVRLVNNEGARVKKAIKAIDSLSKISSETLPLQEVFDEFKNYKEKYDFTIKLANKTENHKGYNKPALKTNIRKMTSHYIAKHLYDVFDLTALEERVLVPISAKNKKDSFTIYDTASGSRKISCIFADGNQTRKKQIKRCTKYAGKDVFRPEELDQKILAQKLGESFIISIGSRTDLYPKLKIATLKALGKIAAQDHGLTGKKEQAFKNDLFEIYNNYSEFSLGTSIDDDEAIIHILDDDDCDRMLNGGLKKFQNAELAVNQTSIPSKHDIHSEVATILNTKLSPLILVDIVLDHEKKSYTRSGRPSVEGFPGQERHIIPIAFLDTTIRSVVKTSLHSNMLLQRLSKGIMFFVKNQKGFSSLENSAALENSIREKLEEFTEKLVSDSGDKYSSLIASEAMAREIFILFNKGENAVFPSKGNSAEYEIRMYRDVHSAKRPSIAKDDYDIVTTTELEQMREDGQDINGRIRLIRNEGDLVQKTISGIGVLDQFIEHFEHTDNLKFDIIEDYNKLYNYQLRLANIDYTLENEELNKYTLPISQNNYKELLPYHIAKLLYNVFDLKALENKVLQLNDDDADNNEDDDVDNNKDIELYVNASTDNTNSYIICDGQEARDSERATTTGYSSNEVFRKEEVDLDLLSQKLGELFFIGISPFSSFAKGFGEVTEDFLMVVLEKLIQLAEIDYNIQEDDEHLIFDNIKELYESFKEYDMNIAGDHDLINVFQEI